MHKPISKGGRFYKPISNFDKLIAEALDICGKNDVVHNFLIAYQFPITLIENPFKGRFEDKAKQWQSREVPPNLHMNHGKFINLKGDGVDHIIEELKRKGDSNRALYSLIDMKTIVGSGDLPIPGFLVLQFGKLNDSLYCTAYFRALEVSRFLPINVTEMCLVMRKIRENFPDLKKGFLCIHAFRAYRKEDFDCLEKSPLDQVTRGSIGPCLLDKSQKDVVKSWLVSKMQESTVIETAGLEEICNFLKGSRDVTRPIYSDTFLSELERAKNSLIELRSLRKRSSYSKEIQQVTEQFRDHLFCSP